MCRQLGYFIIRSEMHITLCSAVQERGRSMSGTEIRKGGIQVAITFHLGFPDLATMKNISVVMSICTANILLLKL